MLNLSEENKTYTLVAFDTVRYLVSTERYVSSGSLGLSACSYQDYISALFRDVHNPKNRDWYICEYEPFYNEYRRLRDDLKLSKEEVNIGMANWSKKEGMPYVDV